jgi:hypothetical protein
MRSQPGLKIWTKIKTARKLSILLNKKLFVAVGVAVVIIETSIFFSLNIFQKIISKLL